ncbi:MAG: carboxypeptidase-like regulatory domain-containing protein, partial [Cyclobacteriaceae bacterium]|nr:carboxypeptidase-like regulatory domain-containing protein [Cyclobacteriaceae bacterium]
MKSSLTILFLVLSLVLAKSQDLIESRQSSFYTYIFKLKSEEAKTLYKRRNNKSFLDELEGYMHTKVDSFLTDSTYTNTLPPGQYLKAWTDKGQLKVEMASVLPLEAKILDNDTDFLIRFFDFNGQIISDAKVKIGSKNIRFDERIMAFREKKSNLDGLLSITYQGEEAFYFIEKEYSRNGLKRTTLMVLNTIPLRFVWRPVRYVVRLPIDGTKSIIDGYPRGVIGKTTRFFVDAFEKTACLFDPYYCDDYNSGFQGYMVLNKPKYKPGDSIKVKAFIVNKKGKPLNKELKWVINDQRKEITLGASKPYRKGAYSSEFTLHDSLNLTLDKRYYLELQTKRGREVFSKPFQYEEYELSRLFVEAKFNEDHFFKGDSLKIRVTATDENELNLYDARIEVLLQSKNASRFYAPHVFIADTLHFSRKSLKNSGETEVVISTNDFPQANMDMEAIITVFTADNRSESETIQSAIWIEKKEIFTELIADTLRVTYVENKDTVFVQAKIYASDHFGNKKLVSSPGLPARIKIDPLVFDYSIETDSMKEVFGVNRESAMITCNTNRNYEKLQIQVKNPRKIPFSWFLYKQNTEIGRGYTDSLYMEVKEKSDVPYFLSLQYIWGGQVKKDNYQIPLATKKLNLQVLGPKKVFPGQETEFVVKVTDYKGKPVKNVDLTAFSMTSKFVNAPPGLPYLGKGYRSKKVINRFSFEEMNEKFQDIELDYQKWKVIAGLDSIAYYKFLYPGDSIYRYEYPMENGITQFSPFVVEEGKLQKIYYVYVDSRPVYFGWFSNVSPYSFPVSPGLHQLEIRTSDALYVVKNLRFNEGKKLVFSFSGKDTIQWITKTDKNNWEIEKEERERAMKYIFPYRNNWEGNLAYLEQDGMITVLNRDPNKRFVNFGMGAVGPVFPKEVQFNILNNYTSDFVFEPFFEYEIQEKMMKMRGLRNSGNYFPSLYMEPVEIFDDRVFTKDSVEARWSRYLENQRYSKLRYAYPKFTSEGQGKLAVNFGKENDQEQERPINFLLFRYDDVDFMRIYPGTIQQYENLAEGLHKLILFYPQERYSVYDSLEVRPDGLNYYQLDTPRLLEKDTFSLTVSRILDRNISSNRTGTDYFVKQEIMPQFQRKFTYSGVGRGVSGYVFDDLGDPIPGVNILAKGTTFGAVTDLDGYYSFSVPSSVYILSISFIGYVTQEIPANGFNKTVLEPDVTQLQEIVVTGFGTTREKKALGYSVVTIGDNEYDANFSGFLQGRAAGVSITRMGGPGSAPTIQIRGVSTSFSGEPLYVIDGVLYEGVLDSINYLTISNVEILKDASATAIYGSRGSNGVVIITTGGSGLILPEVNNPTEESDTLFDLSAAANSIRNNFSDYAFWQPRLTTNSDGIARFNSVFPDDVTSWDTYYLAMNDKKQSGQTTGSIKSYKPLMAQLALPNFIVEGDSIAALGKLLNYSPEGQKVNVSYVLNGKTQFSKTETVEKSLVDTLMLIASSRDTIKAQYTLQKEDGYLDGEMRELPVYRKGMEKSMGWFWMLDNDTSFTVNFDTELSEKVHLYAKTDELDVWEMEINRLKNYRYSCNEQKASRITALIFDDFARQVKGKKPQNKKAVERLIKQLFDDRNNDGLW